MKRESPPAASAWVRRFAALVAPDGAVLDVAAGGGRHSRLFLDRGHAVTAIDRDTSGLGDLVGRTGFECLAVDLENGAAWPLMGRRFAAVIVTNYLFRPLFPALTGAIDEAGLLLYETFAIGQADHGRPRNPAFLLKPGELLTLASDGGLAVVAYEHGMTTGPSVVQRLAAVRGTALQLID
ncbi:MAG: class I SAM-dependent methyltransferase [Alphaproteobacteria bacterium]|nr:class I SAM-dependent methyltransferase [Alphaproteobacteria bacterium]